MMPPMGEGTGGTKADMLRRFRVLRSAPEAELEWMAEALEVLDVRAGQRLTLEGRRSPAIYFLVDGRAVAERDGSPVAALGPGDVIADVTGLHGAGRGATVQAVTPLRALVSGPGAAGALLDRFVAAVEAVEAVGA